MHQTKRASEAGYSLITSRIAGHLSIKKWVQFLGRASTKLPLIFTPMFSFFRKKSELDQLTDQYRALLEESFKLSTTDRKASDLKRAEAEEVALKMEELQKNAK